MGSCWSSGPWNSLIPVKCYSLTVYKSYQWNDNQCYRPIHRLLVYTRPQISFNQVEAMLLNYAAVDRVSLTSITHTQFRIRHDIHIKPRDERVLKRLARLDK